MATVDNTARPGMMGSMVSRMMLALRAGLSFGTQRDVYRIFGYSRALTVAELRDRVVRQDVVRTCLYKPAEAVWTSPPIVTGAEEFMTAWNKIVRKHLLWSVLLRADKILGIEPYSILFLGAPGNPETPLSKTDILAYIQPYGASCATVSNFDQNVNSERYGMPEFYNLSASDGSKGMTIKAHWTRCVHMTNELTEQNYTSQPRILVAYNLFDDLAKVVGGSAETFWLTANKGMQVDVDKEMELDEDDAQALSDELDEFQHQLRRYIRTRGVKITNLGSDVADPRGVFEVLVGLLAGTYGIPQRVLMGSEAGQLASEQDRANWAQVVEARRTSVAEPYMLIPLIERLIAVGILPASEDYKFTWPDAFHMSPLESAQTMAQSARAVVNLSRQAQFGTPVASQEEARLICGLPAQPAAGETMPVMAPKPDTKPVDTSGKSNPTDVTGVDEGNDGVVDTKKGSKDTAGNATDVPSNKS